MADSPGPQKRPTVSPEDLNALSELAQSLDMSIASARSPYMRSIYIRLRAEVSKDLRKSRAAQEREIMASHRRAIKEAREVTKDMKPPDN